MDCECRTECHAIAHADSKKRHRDSKCSRHFEFNEMAGPHSLSAKQPNRNVMCSKRMSEDTLQLVPIWCDGLLPSFHRRVSCARLFPIQDDKLNAIFVAVLRQFKNDDNRFIGRAHMATTGHTMYTTLSLRIGHPDSGENVHFDFGGKLVFRLCDGSVRAHAHSWHSGVRANQILQMKIATIHLPIVCSIFNSTGSHTHGVLM